MVSCGLLRLAVAGCGWLQVAMVGQRLAMDGRAWQRLTKMCLLLSNTARVGDEGVSQDGRSRPHVQKRGEYRSRIVRRKMGRQGHVHGVEVDLEKCGNWFHIFLRSYELVMNFRRLNPFMKIIKADLFQG